MEHNMRGKIKDRAQSRIGKTLWKRLPFSGWFEKTAENKRLSRQTYRARLKQQLKKDQQE
ncbi:hypothetical protein RCDURKIN_1 [Rhodobacter phage RcDurkin]|nr:hypothetical protein RCDURKIN_1 [Rhodobacter phage RcDurkin]